MKKSTGSPRKSPVLSIHRPARARKLTFDEESRTKAPERIKKPLAGG